MKQDDLSIIKVKVLNILLLLYIVFNLIYGFVKDINYYLNDNLIGIITYFIIYGFILFLWLLFYMGFVWAKISLIVVLIINIFIYALMAFVYLAFFNAMYVINSIISFIFTLILIRSKELKAYLLCKRPPSNDEWLLKVNSKQSKKAFIIYTILLCFNIMIYIGLSIYLSSWYVGNLLFLFPILILMYYRMNRGYSTARICFCIILLLFVLILLTGVFEEPFDITTVFLIIESVIFCVFGVIPICSKKLKGHFFLKWINRA